MYVKYYGFFKDEVSGVVSPRSTFLSDGFFRFTQPKYLNDKGSESKILPFFNEFSPADIAWARKRHAKITVGELNTPTHEELINFYLKPMGIRYGDSFPEMIEPQTGFKSMDEYDESQFKSIVKEFNNVLLEGLSCKLGILSLCKTATNELMWTHYASEGKGIAISFKENHPFFKEHIPKDVTYNPENRATLTYFKGSLRMNGEPIHNFKKLLEDEANLEELKQGLMYSKAQKWAHEDEVRIVCPLQSCEKKTGDKVTPSIEIDDSSEFSNFFENYSKVCLKKIPFDAFDTLILGYAISEDHKTEIIEKVKANTNLNHLKLKLVQHDFYGDLEIIDLI